MADVEGTEDPSLLTPLGKGFVKEVVYEERLSGIFGTSHYHTAGSLEEVPSGATVFKIIAVVPQTGPNGEATDPVTWTETCP